MDKPLSERLEEACTGVLIAEATGNLSIVTTAVNRLMDAARDAAAALEAAREDACVALVADIRFACGDNGKRMQRELVEFIRELAKDAERLDFVMRHVRGSELRRIGIHTNGGDHRPAIDQARGKAGQGVGR